MNWVEVTVHTTTEGSEIVANALEMVGAGGAVIEDKADIARYQRDEGDWDYIDDEIGSRMAEDVLVKSYLPDDARIPESLTLLRQSLAEIAAMDLGSLPVGTLAVETRGVNEEDWANNWKKYYKPFAVGSRLWVRPQWEQAQVPEGRVPIVMDPGMAFGTGTHETTFMCMELLEDYVRPGALVYDIGCGTGILAIAALRLGAKHAVAVDRDPVCVSAVHNNMALNGIDEQKLTVELGNLLDEQDGQRDVLVANIIADVIILMAGDGWEHIKPGGVMIASGIIKEKEADVRLALQNTGFTIEQAKHKGEWVAIAARKA
jgi:ribosomal protein L11 methyltransferase